MVAPAKNETDTGSKNKVTLLSALIQTSMNAKTNKMTRSYQSATCGTDCLHCKDATIRVISQNNCISNGEVGHDNTFLVQTNRQSTPFIQFRVQPSHYATLFRRHH